MKYVVIPSDKFTIRHVNLSNATSIKTVKHCPSGCHIIIETETPERSDFLDYPQYTKDQAIELMNTEHWNAEDAGEESFMAKLLRFFT